MSGPVDRWVTPLDRRLLAALAVEPNVVHAARALGIGRDRAVYRLQRLRRLFGGPVVEGRRGGSKAGGSGLTRRGRRLLARSAGVRPGANVWPGTYRRRPSPHVLLDGGARLEVAFGGRDGAPVACEIDPEAIVVARRPAALSARNALRATVESLRRRRDGSVELSARWCGRRVRVALTAGSVGRLGLAQGRSAYLYVKATAIRPLPWVAGPAPARRRGPLRS